MLGWLVSGTPNINIRRERFGYLFGGHQPPRIKEIEGGH